VTRKVLVVFAHPEAASFVGSLRDVVASIAAEKRAEVRQHDLYDEGFSAVLSLNEWQLHRAAPETKPHLVRHFEDLQWCDTLVFVYPTWWSAQPAILKAWMDRVIAHDVAWNVKDGADRISPGLSNVKRLVAITTHGSQIHREAGDPCFVLVALSHHVAGDVRRGRIDARGARPFHAAGGTSFAADSLTESRVLSVLRLPRSARSRRSETISRWLVCGNMSMTPTWSSS
jgi:putative NADPH-quinone reductase